MTGIRAKIQRDHRRSTRGVGSFAMSLPSILAIILAIVSIVAPYSARGKSLKKSQLSGPESPTSKDRSQAGKSSSAKAAGSGGVSSTNGLSRSNSAQPGAATAHHSDDYYSWQHCVELVNKNNADLLAGANNIKAADQTLHATYMDFLPNIESEYNLGHTRTNGVQADASNVVLQASETVFSGFKTSYVVKQNEAALRSAKAAFRTTQAAVSAELVTAYEGFLYARAFKKLTESIIERREENLRLVTLRFESGGENKGSVLLSGANLEQARFDDLQAANASALAQRQLAKVMGIDDHTPFEIDEAVPIRDPESAPDIQALAIDTPDYTVATSTVEFARAQIGVSRSPFYPLVNFNVGISKNGVEGIPNDANNSFYGMQIKLDWFSPFGTYFKQQNATSAYRVAESNRLSTARNLLVKLETAYQSYVEGVSRFKVATAFKEAADVRAEIARAKYKNGLITFDEWDIIENDLIQREKDFVSSERDRVNAESSWYQAQGKGVL